MSDGDIRDFIFHPAYHGAHAGYVQLRQLCDVKFHTCTLLKISKNAKEVFWLRIAAWAEHPDKTLRLGSCRFAELFKSDGGLDIVAQDRLAGFDIPAQQRIDTFTKKRFGKLSCSS